jgi:hypothetical protein
LTSSALRIINDIFARLSSLIPAMCPAHFSQPHFLRDVP